VVDTEQWHCLSAVVARMTGSSVLIGFSTNDRRKLFNHAIPYFQDDYEVESFHRLLAPINLNNSQPVSVPYLHIYPELEHQADALLGQHAKTLFVVIFPGASISEKRWEADKFRQLVIQLGGVGVNAVLIGGKNDVDAAQIIVAGTDALNLAGKTSLVETAAVIARGAVLVSGDSGVLHMAVGLGKSTVSLFGPSSIKKWSPKGGDHVVIHRNLQCSPCSQFGHTPRCKIKAKCMSEITVDEALDAVIKLLKQQSELC
jgi:ADP-heptose:LPS heptosyltransferase